MALIGKGVYLWQIKTVAGGDARKIASMAAEAQITHVLIKVADGVYGYNFSHGTDLVPGVVAALKAKGIQAWGWQYVYGANYRAEAQKAIDRVRALRLNGFIVNAEGQFKAKGMGEIARKYMRLIKAGLAGVPIGLSSYRYPSAHPLFPFGAFLEYCDFNFPQIYWVAASNPVQQLQKSYDEFKALRPWRAYIPTGAAFGYGDWTATPAQINQFISKARDMQLPAVNFWEMGLANQNGARLWKAVQEYDWATGTAPAANTEPEPEPTTNWERPASVATNTNIIGRYLSVLNGRSSNRAGLLYEKINSKLIGPGRARRGRDEIEYWYRQLFTKIMPKAKFSFRTWSWRGNEYKIAWTATAGSKAWSGSDTLYMSTANPNLISLHYTSIPGPKSIDADDVAGSEPGPIPV